MRYARLAPCVVLVLALGGCTSIRADAVSSVAERFYGALADRQGAAACRLLAPQTRSELEESARISCRRAVLAQGIPAARGATGMSVYGTMGQVRFPNDTVFLAEFADGWKVMAAGCKPVAGAPYDCRVSGG